MADIPVQTRNRDYENTDLQNNSEDIVYILDYPNIRIHSSHFAPLSTFMLHNFPCCYLWVASSTTFDESLILAYTHTVSAQFLFFVELWK
jgi:hypothetical protein